MLVDITRPRTMRELSRLTIDGPRITALAFYSSWLVAVSKDALHMIDLSDPQQPVSRARLALEYGTGDPFTGTLLTVDGPLVVASRIDHQGTIDIFGASSLAQPYARSSLRPADIPGGPDHVLEEMELRGSLLYLFYRDRLVTVDLAIPGRPQVLGHVMLEGSHAKFALSGRHVVTVNSRQGSRLVLVDKILFTSYWPGHLHSVPIGPPLDEMALEATLPKPSGITVLEGLVHVCAHDGLHAYTLAGGRLTERSIVPILTERRCSNPLAGWSAGRYFVAFTTLTHELHVFDLTNLDDPIRAAQLPLVQYGNQLDFLGDDLLVASGGLLVYQREAAYTPTHHRFLPWLAR